MAENQDLLALLPNDVLSIVIPLCSTNTKGRLGLATKQARSIALHPKYWHSILLDASDTPNLSIWNCQRLVQSLAETKRIECRGIPAVLAMSLIRHCPQLENVTPDQAWEDVARREVKETSIMQRWYAAALRLLNSVSEVDETTTKDRYSQRRVFLAKAAVGPEAIRVDSIFRQARALLWDALWVGIANNPGNWSGEKPLKATTPDHVVSTKVFWLLRESDPLLLEPVPYFTAADHPGGEVFYNKRVYHQISGKELLYIAPDVLVFPSGRGALRVIFFHLHTQQLLAELNVTAKYVEKMGKIDKKVLKYETVQCLNMVDDLLLVTSKQFSFLFKVTRTNGSFEFELLNQGLDFGFESSYYGTVRLLKDPETSKHYVLSARNASYVQCIDPFVCRPGRPDRPDEFIGIDRYSDHPIVRLKEKGVAMLEHDCEQGGIKSCIIADSNDLAAFATFLDKDEDASYFEFIRFQTPSMKILSKKRVVIGKPSPRWSLDGAFSPSGARFAFATTQHRDGQSHSYLHIINTKQVEEDSEDYHSSTTVPSQEWSTNRIKFLSETEMLIIQSAKILLVTCTANPKQWEVVKTAKTKFEALELLPADFAPDGRRRFLLTTPTNWKVCLVDELETLDKDYAQSPVASVSVEDMFRARDAVVVGVENCTAGVGGGSLWTYLPFDQLHFDFNLEKAQITPTSKSAARFPFVNGRIRDCLITPTDTLVLYSLKDAMAVYSVSKREEMYPPLKAGTHLKDWGTGGTFMSDSRIAIVADKSCKIFDLKNNKLLNSKPVNGAFCIMSDPGRNFFLVGATHRTHACAPFVYNHAIEMQWEGTPSLNVGDVHKASFTKDARLFVTSQAGTKVVTQIKSISQWEKTATLARGHGDAIEVYRHQEEIHYIKFSPSEKKLAVCETASRKPWGLNIANALLRIFDSSDEDPEKWKLLTVFDLGANAFSVCWIDERTLLVGTEVSSIFTISLDHIIQFPL